MVSNSVVNLMTSCLLIDNMSPATFARRRSSSVPDWIAFVSWNRDRGKKEKR